MRTFRRRWPCGAPSRRSVQGLRRRRGAEVALFKQKYPEEIAKRIRPGQRLVKGWPVLQFGSVPTFDESTWDFRVYGQVENEYTLTYSELKALPNVNVPADMHCVTGWTTLDNAWEGIS